MRYSCHVQTHTPVRKRSFVRVALRDHKVGALAGSSKYLVRRVLNLVPDTCKVIIEYGAGDGVMTRALLTRLAPEGTLFAIEPNREFVEELRAIRDARLVVIEGLAHDIMQGWVERGMPPADLVLSSVPFSFMRPTDRIRMVSNTYDALRIGGRFIIFHQYWPLARQVLKRVFGEAVSSYEWKNVFPCFIFVSRKLKKDMVG
jgi:phospholipid N-methyltransferase